MWPWTRKQNLDRWIEVIAGDFIVLESNATSDEKAAAPIVLS